MTLTEAKLTDITRRLVAAYRPEQIVLFGSHAWGEPNESSDVDLLVVLSESDEPAYRRAAAGYRSLFGVGVPCDVCGCVPVKKCFGKHRCPPRSRTRSFGKAGSCMAEPLNSQAWVAAWPQKASQDLDTAERALHAGYPVAYTAA